MSTGAAAPESSAAGVWADLVGQEPTVQVLRAAAAAAVQSRTAGGAEPAARASEMTHAWLLTGPPGSGRSNAARAFAAALQCERARTEGPDTWDPWMPGCGECTECRTVMAGTNPDVTLVRTEHLSLRVDEIRELVRKSAMSPVGQGFQVLIVEDADRLTEQAADALLKSLEEPAERTVWVLCAPAVADVVPTIRSRCRLLVLRTPPTAAVAEVLRRRDGVDEETALFAARASQGHIGRARALATKPEVRERREQVLAVPGKLGRLTACIDIAAELVELATEEAKQATAELDAAELEELEHSYELTSGGKAARGRSRALESAKKELQEQQKVRAKRLQRDALDRTLLDLLAYYRDVLVVAMGAGATTELVNEDHRADIERRARVMRPEEILHDIDAILACRDAIAANVAPLLAMEAMLIALWKSQDD